MEARSDEIVQLQSLEMGTPIGPEHAGVHPMINRSAWNLRFLQKNKSWPVGSPFHRASRMDPLVSKRQYDRVTDYLASAKKDGRVLFGGGRPQELVGLPDTSLGYFIEPTAIVDIDNGARACQEEIFDPVATIIPFGARSAYCQ